MSVSSSILHSTRVQAVIERLFQTADSIDRDAIPRAFADAEKAGIARNDRTVKDALREAYMAIDRPTALFLYNVVRAREAATVVEFGMSFGISTLHLAAAVKDLGAGRIVSTEMEPSKVKAAASHLVEAGLDDVVEILEGDALVTLREWHEPVDVLFLDGWKELYLPVLKLLEPRLSRNAVVVADDLAIMPEVLEPYLRYVRDPSNGYISVEIPIGDSLELSVRA